MNSYKIALIGCALSAGLLVLGVALAIPPGPGYMIIATSLVIGAVSAISALALRPQAKAGGSNPTTN